MKKIVLLTLALALFLLAACASINEGVSVPEEPPSPSHLPTSPVVPSKTATPSPVSTPTGTPMPVPTLTPDEDIPDVMIDTAEKANSNDTLYEDDENIYYQEGRFHGGDLLVINKSSGVIKKIAGDCHGFTFNDGWLYYYQMEDSPFTVESYDVEADAGKTIVSLAYPVSQIACYDGRIYFTKMSETVLDSGETHDNLYVTDPNGKQIKKIQEDAYSFCWYNDRLFYINIGGADGGLFYEYNEDGETLIFSPSIDYFFDVSLNKIVFTELLGNNHIFSINTGEIKEIPLTCYYFDMIGQYMIFTDDAEGHDLLKAYDFLEDKEYTLMDLSNFVDETTEIDFEVSGENIYLCMDHNYEWLEMYRVTIADGRASIEHVATIED